MAKGRHTFDMTSNGKKRKGTLEFRIKDSWIVEKNEYVRRMPNSITAFVPYGIASVGHAYISDTLSFGMLFFLVILNK